jgi:copper chaperone CopZ
MQKTKFKISGLKCDNCPLLIEEKLKHNPGIAKIKVDQASSKGVVIFDENKTNEPDIFKIIEGINGFGLEKIEEIAEEPEQDLGIRKTKFKVKGLKCNSCVLLIEDRLKQKAGIVKVKVDQASNRGVVIYDMQKINESEIYNTIEEIGEFEVEKFKSLTETSEESDDYEDPDGSEEIKPPINF